MAGAMSSQRLVNKMKELTGGMRGMITWRLSPKMKEPTGGVGGIAKANFFGAKGVDCAA